MLGGGAGTYASLGKQGPPVQQGIGRLAAACGKIGREIYTLMKTEFGEVEEPVPPGTSTMQQKRNPKLCQDIIAAAAGGRGLVPLALEAMTAEHEADRTTSLMMDAAGSRACIATGDILSRLGKSSAGCASIPSAGGPTSTSVAGLSWRRRCST